MKRVEQQKLRKCSECQGAGVKRNYGAVRVSRPLCKFCNGTGYVKKEKERKE